MSTTHPGDERRQKSPAEFPPRVYTTPDHLFDVVIETISTFSSKVKRYVSSLVRSRRIYCCCYDAGGQWRRNYGDRGYIVPPPQVQDLYPVYHPSQRCGLCQNFKQTTLTTSLYKVRKNLYPPLRKSSDAPVGGGGV